MEEKFINAFKEALEIKSGDINLETVFRELSEWDSLAFLSVIAMIDEEFSIVIEGKDFRSLITVGDIINEIKRRKV